MSDALRKLSYGLFVLSAKENGFDNACIINTAMQVASNPDVISISVNKTGFTHDMVKRTGVFTLSTIDQTADFDLFKTFGFVSGKDQNKFQNFSLTKRVENGLLAVTKGANSYISAKVINEVELKTHTLFIAEITNLGDFNDNLSATYEFYHNNIKPKPKKIESKKTLWRCMICGYELEYDGDTLPEDFVCPLCKHPASDFVKVI